MPSLYSPTFPPTWQIPAPVLQRRPSTPASTIRQVTWSFDPPNHDFAVDGSGDVPLTDAGAAAVQWAAKAVSTQRGAHLIYSRSFGCDIRRSLRAGGHQAVQNALTAAMRAAVKPDPRINDLTNFQFSWHDQNALYVAYTVVLSDGRKRQTFLTIPLH